MFSHPNFVAPRSDLGEFNSITSFDLEFVSYLIGNGDLSLAADAGCVQDVFLMPVRWLCVSDNHYDLDM